MTRIEAPADVSRVQSTIANRLPPVPGRKFVGIIGDRPSQSAKSPSIWNPVFKTLELPVTYVPFDVEPQRLEAVVQALRASSDYLGGNVTMPYKVAVMPYLDEIDAKARDIGAVNTIVRSDDGRLFGYNTDGQGGLDSLTRAQPGYGDPLMATLSGRGVLMVGAGGAGRALGFYLADALGPSGRLDIVNRDHRRGRDLAEAIDRRHHNCRVVDAIEAGAYDLIVNVSTVGQFGVRCLPDGRATCLEPFSPLAKADAPALSMDSTGDDLAFYAEWGPLAAGAISSNNAAALDVMARVPRGTVVFDIIFSPLESVFLRHARLTGHRVLNGKGMNVRQAAEGFFNRVCRTLLEDRGLHTSEGYDHILATMYSAW